MVNARVEWQRVVAFVGFTFFFSYTLAFLFFAFGAHSRLASTWMLIAYMFIPMAVALILSKWVYKLSLADLGLSWELNRWFAVAWLLPPSLALGAFGLSLLFPDVSYAPDLSGVMERLRPFLTDVQRAEMESGFRGSPVRLPLISLAFALVTGATINAVPAFGEEVGWRGYLLRELAPLGFWCSSLLIGAIWGLWHVPLVLYGYNYPEHPLAGILMMTAFCILLSPLFTYVRLKARSIIAVAILHGTVNASLGLATLAIKGGSDLTVGMTGLAGLIALAIVDSVLWLLGIRGTFRGYRASEKETRNPPIHTEELLKLTENCHDRL